MSFLCLLPVLLSLLVLAAHFLRAGSMPAVLFCLLTPLVLLIPRKAAVRFVQVVLVLGALQWMLILPGLVAEHQEEGRPWVRMVVILMCVSFFTLASAAVFLLPPLRKRYFRTGGAGSEVPLAAAQAQVAGASVPASSAR